MIRSASKLFVILLFTLLAAMLPACTAEEQPSGRIEVVVPKATKEADTQQIEVDTDLPAIMDVLSNDPELALFVNALSSSGTLSILEGDGPFTVLAVPNLAFAKLAMPLSQLGPEIVQGIGRHHIIEGSYSTADMAQLGSARAINGERMAFTSDGTIVKVDYAAITTADIEATNGTVHIVNALLLPPEVGAAEKSIWTVLLEDDRFEILVSLIASREAMYALRFSDQPDAFLAPTDDAFAQLPQGMLDDLLLDEHAVELLLDYLTLTPDGWPQDKNLLSADMLEMGEVKTDVGNTGYGYEKLPVSRDNDGQLMIGTANIIEADIAAANGAVHVIDEVLLPEGLLEAAGN